MRPVVTAASVQQRLEAPPDATAGPAIALAVLRLRRNFNSAEPGSERRSLAKPPRPGAFRQHHLLGPVGMALEPSQPRWGLTILRVRHLRGRQMSPQSKRWMYASGQLALNRWSDAARMVGVVHRLGAGRAIRQAPL